MNKEILKLINKLYTQELKAAIMFKSGAHALELENLPNIAKALTKLSMDKFDIHLSRICEFLSRFGYELNIGDLTSTNVLSKEKDPSKYVIDIINQLIENEEITRKVVLDIASSCLKENEHDAYQFIQWFVKDTMEDINELAAIVNYIKMSNSILTVERIYQE